ncbi:hypothetical protein DIPPA_30841 [Diplonema papillatum]|nr:hypothetical protein DIPPA_30841 [Diplonema papillatum]
MNSVSANASQRSAGWGPPPQARRLYTPLKEAGYSGAPSPGILQEVALRSPTHAKRASLWDKTLSPPSLALQQQGASGVRVGGAGYSRVESPARPPPIGKAGDPAAAQPRPPIVSPPYQHTPHWSSSDAARRHLWDTEAVASPVSVNLAYGDTEYRGHTHGDTEYRGHTHGDTEYRGHTHGDTEYRGHTHGDTEYRGHTHGDTEYRGHTHGDTEYRGHTHGDTEYRGHTHGDTEYRGHTHGDTEYRGHTYGVPEYRGYTQFDTPVGVPLHSSVQEDRRVTTAQRTQPFVIEDLTAAELPSHRGRAQFVVEDLALAEEAAHRRRSTLGPLHHHPPHVDGHLNNKADVVLPRRESRLAGARAVHFVATDGLSTEVLLHSPTYDRRSASVPQRMDVAMPEVLVQSPAHRGREMREVAPLEGRCASIPPETARLLQRMDALMRQVAAKDDQNNDLATQVAAHRIELDAVARQLAAKDDRNSDLAAQLAAHHVELDAAVRQLAAKDDRNNDLAAQLAAHRVELDAVTRQLAVKDDWNCDLAAQLTAHRVQRDTAEAGQRNDAAALRTEFDALLRQAAVKDDQNNDLAAQLDASQAELSPLRRRVAELEAGDREQRAAHLRETDRLRDEAADAAKELRALREEAEGNPSAEARLRESEGALADKTEEAEHLAARCGALKEAHCERVLLLEEQLAAAEADAEDLRRHLAAAAEAAKQWERKAGSLDAESAEQAALAAAKTREADELRSAAAGLEARCRALEEDYDAAARRLRQAGASEEKLARAERRDAALAEDNRGLAVDNAGLEKKCKDLAAQRDRWQRVAESRGRTDAAALEEVAAVERDRMRATVADLEAECREAKEDRDRWRTAAEAVGKASSESPRRVQSPRGARPLPRQLEEAAVALFADATTILASEGSRTVSNANNPEPSGVELARVMSMTSPELSRALFRDLVTERSVGLQGWLEWNAAVHAVCGGDAYRHLLEWIKGGIDSRLSEDSWRPAAAVVFNSMCPPNAQVPLQDLAGLLGSNRQAAALLVAAGMPHEAGCVSFSNFVAWCRKQSDPGLLLSTMRQYPDLLPP